MRPTISRTDFQNNLKGKTVRKELTFANDAAGTVDLFTVTGDVIIRLIAVCKTNVASAAGANIECGVAGDTNIMIVSTLATDIDANEIWHDATPDVNTELESVSKDVIISNSDDIILTLDAQVDSGMVVFYLFYIPLSTDGNVVAA